MGITIKIEIDGREVVNQKIEETANMESKSYSQYEVGPAWDGFRAGAAEAEREIHGGFTTTVSPRQVDKFKEEYKEWLQKNPHTDISTLYPETHFIFPGRSAGKVLFTKAWMNAMYGTPMYSIKNVIFNDPATIVFWSDGTKTVVKTQDNEMGDHEIYDPEKGLAMAISKKALGNKREYYHTFLHWLKKYEKENAVIEALKEKIKKITIPKLNINHLDIVKEEHKRSAVQKAYDLAVKFRDTSEIVSIDDIIGYLGEALED